MHVSGVTVTILADNRAAYGLEAEHGFACWVRTASRTILLDTGRGEAMPRNAESLGIDIGTADTIVLSHGHYDHTGNVPYALARAKQADLFLHPEAVGERYSFHNEAKPIGMPAASQAAVYGLSESRCRWVEVAQELDAGI